MQTMQHYVDESYRNYKMIFKIDSSLESRLHRANKSMTSTEDILAVIQTIV